MGVYRPPNRQKLTGNLTLYVRADGNDANSGRANTAAGALLTLQAAINRVRDTLDLGGFNVTISVGAGTFGGVSMDGHAIGRGTVTLQGAGATTIIQGTGAGAFAASDTARLTIANVKLQTSGAGHALQVEWGAHVTLSGVEFGAASGGAHMLVRNGGRADFAGSSITISGNSAYAMLVQAGGYVQGYSSTITFSGSVTFSSTFVWVDSGLVWLHGATYVNTFTGKRYTVDRNGYLRTGGATLPGTVAGTTSTSGDTDSPAS